MDKQVFEIHITIEPVFEERLKELQDLSSPHFFKVATLLMQKRSFDTPTVSKNDTFMTAHRTSMNDSIQAITDLIPKLKEAGFKIFRYKIEEIKLDTRSNGDVLNLLG